VLFPEPGGPVTPTRYDFFLFFKFSKISFLSEEFFSICDIALDINLMFWLFMPSQISFKSLSI
tara:strand:+ start:121 stop:309 length:189 start_codon:yes stop_codon:yes gene_type:complete